jgi:hypothetical protein
MLHIALRLRWACIYILGDVLRVCWFGLSLCWRILDSFSALIVAELECSTTTCAQEDIFVNGRNEGVHISSQQIWVVDIFIPCCRLISAFKCYVARLLSMTACFSFTSPPSHRVMPSHINRATTVINWLLNLSNIQKDRDRFLCATTSGATVCILYSSVGLEQSVCEADHSVLLVRKYKICEKLPSHLLHASLTRCF